MFASSKSGRAVWLGGFAMLFAVATCGGRDDRWDGDEVELCGPVPAPDCGGVAGARCSISDDCDDGVCCPTNDCGRGMCTYLCGGDPDCPPGMRCHDGFCFFACSSDANCGPGQKCEHGETVCQYD